MNSDRYSTDPDFLRQPCNRGESDAHRKKRELLNSRRLPARLTMTEAGELLGFQEHEMGVLMRTKLLKPLGNPAPNAHKYFSTVEILALTNDPA